MRTRQRRLTALYGLPVATALFGVAGTVLGLMSVPVGAAVAVAGTVLVATFDVLSRARTELARVAEQRRALAQLAEAARTFWNRLASGMPLGGTSVPEGSVRERVVSMARMLREGDWAWLGTALTNGRAELLRSAALTGGRLPVDEDARVRSLAASIEDAARHANELASRYAGYDVTEEPKRARYAPEDRDVGDVSAIDAYRRFADEFTNILTEFDRMARLDAIEG